MKLQSVVHHFVHWTGEKNQLLDGLMFPADILHAKVTWWTYVTMLVSLTSDLKWSLAHLHVFFFMVYDVYTVKMALKNWHNGPIFVILAAVIV